MTIPGIMVVWKTSFFSYEVQKVERFRAKSPVTNTPITPYPKGNRAGSPSRPPKYLSVTIPLKISMSQYKAMITVAIKICFTKSCFSVCLSPQKSRGLQQILANSIETIIVLVISSKVYKIFAVGGRSELQAPVLALNPNVCVITLTESAKLIRPVNNQKRFLFFFSCKPLAEISPKSQAENAPFGIAAIISQNTSKISCEKYKDLPGPCQENKSFSAYSTFKNPIEKATYTIENPQRKKENQFLEDMNLESLYAFSVSPITSILLSPQINLTSPNLGDILTLYRYTLRYKLTRRCCASGGS